MNKQIPFLSCLLGLWIIGTSFWRYSEGCCQVAAPISAATISTTAPVVAAPLTPTSTAPLPPAPSITSALTIVSAPTKLISIADNGTAFSTILHDNLSFEGSKHNFVTPVSDSLHKVFVNVVNYLKENPSRSIQLTGLYQSEETNNSMLSTLGLGRANQVKKMLVDLGAPTTQIALRGNETITIQKEESTLTNAVTYEFFETQAIDKQELKEIAKQLRSNTLRLYFDKNAKNLVLNDEQRQFLTDVVRYLSQEPKAILKSTGHTDNTGDDVYNRYFSRKRAEFVRNYLIENGINEKQIWVKYEGSDQPIADNETIEGRAQNRRVEVTLK